jgi:hypothetical protein
MSDDHETKAARAYCSGRLHGALIRAVTMARIAWAAGDVSVLSQALQDVSAAEAAAGVDLTSPSDEDLLAAGRSYRLVLQCPSCGAAPGEGCTDRNGRPRKNGFHSTRSPTSVRLLTRVATHTERMGRP